MKSKSVNHFLKLLLELSVYKNDPQYYRRLIGSACLQIFFHSDLSAEKKISAYFKIIILKVNHSRSVDDKPKANICA